MFRSIALTATLSLVSLVALNQVTKYQPQCWEQYDTGHGFSVQSPVGACEAQITADLAYSKASLKAEHPQFAGGYYNVTPHYMKDVD